MQHVEISRTAALAAISRAAHQELDAEPKILADPVSPKLAGLLRSEGALEVLRGLPPSLLATGRSAIVLRSRYAEDVLAASCLRGCSQFVILGAGLDTFAYRQPPWALGLKIFEIDRPEMLEAKRRLLAQAGIADPPNLVRLASRLESNTLEGDLRGSGFDPRAPAVFSMLGLAQYLCRETIECLLRSVARSVRGTLLVLSFLVPAERLSGLDLELARRFEAFAAAAGEPVVSAFEPDELRKWLERLGFREIQQFTPGDAAARYFAGRGDLLRPPEMERILRAEV